MGEYLDSRFIQSNQLRKINRIDGKGLKGDNEDYCIAACDLNPDECSLKEKVIEAQKAKDEDGDEDEEENDGGVIRVDLLDVPRIHNPNDPIAMAFIKAIAGVEDPSYLFKF